MLRNILILASRGQSAIFCAHLAGQHVASVAFGIQQKQKGSFDLFYRLEVLGLLYGGLFSKIIVPFGRQENDYSRFIKPDHEKYSLI